MESTERALALAAGREVCHCRIHCTSPCPDRTEHSSTVILLRACHRCARINTPGVLQKLRLRCVLSSPPHGFFVVVRDGRGQAYVLDDFDLSLHWHTRHADFRLRCPSFVVFKRWRKAELGALSIDGLCTEQFVS
jgi:hypothetical protein